MGERTTYAPGTFSWIDLATTDQEGGKRFYAELLGWDFEDMPAGEGVTYSMASLGGRWVAAVAPQVDQEREMGIPPHWNSYVTVDDVDAVARRAGELGGAVLAGPFDVMEAGRMAVVADPPGAVVSLWAPRRHPGAGLVNAPGALCWNELATRDPDRSQEFWSGLLGWRFEPFQGAGAYWTIQNGGRTNGGMRVMGDETPPETPPHWLVYLAVEDVNAGAARAEQLGGTVHVPRTEIGPGAFALIGDPAGAVFALYEGHLDD